jgi:hypothetical protein
MPFVAMTVVLALPFVVVARRRAGGARGPGGAAIASSLAIAVAIGFALLWASYGFSSGRVRGVPVPMPELLTGMRMMAEENRAGHESYLLGETYTMGKPHFFVIALLVKSPIAFLLLAAPAIVHAVRRFRDGGGVRWMLPLCGVAAVLIVASASNLNRGTRYVLPIYALLSVLIGPAVAAAWRGSRHRRAVRATVVAALGWLAISSAAAHPDYLAYFNAFAGREPGRVLVSSDLDWGQDVDRLGRLARARGIDSVELVFFGSGERWRHVLPHARALSDGMLPRGRWLAVSETAFRRQRYRFAPALYAHLASRAPVAWAGRSIRVYDLRAGGVP